MAETSKRQSMGSVDKAWLEMDRETNLMIINGVMLFDGKVDYAVLRDTFERRMVTQFPLFRRRVVESSVGSGRIYWEDDPYFDIRSHLLHIALPEPGTTATLQSLISDLMSTGLDRSKPLWRVYLIDNYEGGSALFVRLHHSIADGVALVQVMLSMTQTEDGAPLSPPVALAPRPGAAGVCCDPPPVLPVAPLCAQPRLPEVWSVKALIRFGIRVSSWTQPLTPP